MDRHALARLLDGSPPAEVQQSGKCVSPKNNAEGITSTTMCMNLLKAYLGSGLLAIPWAINSAGFLPGLCSILVLCFLMNHTMKILVQMKVACELERGLQGREGKVDYAEIGQWCMGNTGRLLIQVACMGTNIGIAIGYLVTVGDTLVDVVSVLGGGSLVKFQIGALQVNTPLLVLFPVLVFLCCLRMKSLAFTSLLGNVAMLTTVLIVCCFSAQELLERRTPRPSASELLLPGGTYPLCFGIFMFSFVMHGTVLSQFEALRPAEQSLASASRALNVAAVAVAGIYVGFGALAFWAFSPTTCPGADWSTPASQNILRVVLGGEQSATARFVVRATMLLVVSAILASIPLYLLPVFSSLGWEAGSLSFGRMVLSRAALLLCLLLPAFALGRDFGPVLSLIGALTMSWLGCILPAMFHVSLSRRGHEGFRICTWDGAMSILCGCLGVLGALSGTYAAVLQLK